MDFSFLTIDLIAVFILLAGVLIFAYTIGSDDGVTMLQALYISAFPFYFVPGIIEQLPTFGMPEQYAKMVALGIFWGIVYFILYRNGFFESPMVPSKWEIGVFAILFTGLALAILGSFLPVEEIDQLSPIVQSVFFGDTLLAFWALAPVGFWVLIKGE